MQIVCSDMPELENRFEIFCEFSSGIILRKYFSDRMKAAFIQADTEARDILGALDKWVKHMMS